MQGEKAKKTNRLLPILLFLLLLSISFFTPILTADDKIGISFLPEINLPPYKPIDPTPKNNTTDHPLNVELRVFVSDPNSEFLTVYFYNAKNNQLIDSCIVPNGTYASVNWTKLTPNRYYYWYAIVNDSQYQNISDTWCFKTTEASVNEPEEENIPPVANITAPDIGYVNQNIIFFGNESYDPDGFIVGYRWDFNNDGLFDTDWTPDYYFTHTYLEPGNYTVKLQVVDNYGLQNFSLHNITILELTSDKEFPIPIINGRYEGITYENISFSSEGSYDPDGNITNYTWYFGDGNISHDPNPIHAYSKAGYYIVILVVTDNDNLSQADWTTASIFDDKETTTKKEKPQFSIWLIVIIAILITTIISLAFVLRHREIRKLIEKLDKKP